MAKIKTANVYTPKKHMLFCKAYLCENGEVILESKGSRNFDTISLGQLLLELERNGFFMDGYRYKR